MWYIIYIYIYIKIHSAVVFWNINNSKHGRQEMEEKIREFENKKLKLHNRIIELNKTNNIYINIYKYI